jgi:para-aminobenzoate synthetase / 4-amino-4-deoxychorismate lyase
MVVLKNPQGGGWWLFQEPRRIVQAWRVEHVLPALRQAEAAVDGDGQFAAGFISYEASPAFDPALSVWPDEGFPLLWFGLYDQPRVIELLPAPLQPLELPVDWQPSVTREAYEQAIAQIKEHIACGETYQVNYTLRLRAAFHVDPWGLFVHLVQAQPTEYAAYVDTERFALCSASPELFFQLQGDLLTCRPMKGTAARGRTLAEDRLQAEWLSCSVKDRAENVMIVDMTRNDLGRVAEFGSVQVPRLFQVERYPTVWQMTSTVQARSRASFSEIMQAVFPCASITGAPKASTMSIIAALETTPRRAYTGCIGFYAPGRQARFNVAIRTVTVDRQENLAEYGAGGGIVWDSTSAGEYAECLLKARLVSENRPQFSLLETMLWNAGAGYALLEVHLRRLRDSAEYFAFPLELKRLQAELNSMDARLRAEAAPAQRVRLLVSRQGKIELQAAPILEKGSDVQVRLGLASHPVDSSYPFLYHKTTHRRIYQEALAGCLGCEDVLLWNERGEVTETCIANLVYRLEGQLYTPPIGCGLLPGTFREQLLKQGKVHERILPLAELDRCDDLYVINSVRGWRAAALIVRTSIPSRA